MSYKRLTLVFVLLLIILIFGYSANMLLNANKTNQKSAGSVEDSVLQNQTASENTKPIWLDDLSEVEGRILDVPSNESTNDVKSEYSDLVRSNAKSSSEVVLGAECRPSPIAYSVGESSSIKFKNMDSVSHTISLGPDENHQVDPGAIKEVKFAEEKKGLILSYGCDSLSVNGILVFGRR